MPRGKEIPGLLELGGGFVLFSVAYFWLKNYNFYQLQLFPGVGLSVNISLSDAATVISALASIAAVSVAVRALRHSRSRDHLENETDSAASEAATEVVLREYAEKFTRAFSEIHAQAERFHQHDKECAADKARMIAEQRQLTEVIEKLVNRFDSISRSVGYIAGDRAHHRTDEQLGLTEKKGQT